MQNIVKALKGEIEIKKKKLEGQTAGPAEPPSREEAQLKAGETQQKINRLTSTLEGFDRAMAAGKNSPTEAGARAQEGMQHRADALQDEIRSQEFARSVYEKKAKAAPTDTSGSTPSAPQEMSPMRDCAKPVDKSPEMRAFGNQAAQKGEGGSSNTKTKEKTSAPPPAAPSASQ